MQYSGGSWSQVFEGFSNPPSGGLAVYSFQCETPTKIVLKGETVNDSQQLRWHSKTTGSRTATITRPGGDTDWDLQVSSWDSENSQLVSVWSNPTNNKTGVTRVVENASSAAAIQASDEFSFSGSAHAYGDAIGKDGSGNLYIPVTISGTASILMTDNTGAEIRIFDEATIGLSPISATDIGYRQSPNKGFFWNTESQRLEISFNGTVAQYDPVTNNWESCTISGFTGTSAWALVDENNIEMWGRRLGR